MLNTQYRIFNDGFAIWFSGNSQCFEFDVHINEWIAAKSNFIDIGIRIFNTYDIKNGYIFIPFKLSSSSVVDVAHTLSDEKITRGVFNTACKITIPIDKPIFKIEYNNRIENIIPLDLLKPVTNTIEDGTLIQLSFNDVISRLDTSETYIRFRIPHESLNKRFISPKHNYKSIFESPIITDKINYTIQINESRTLPSRIKYFFADNSQHINKVRVLLSASQEYDIDDSTCYKVRHLEEDLYKNYVPSVFKCDNAITYHWVIENMTHYNFFIKLEIKKLLYKSLLLYSILIILLSFVGNILWKLLTMLPYLNWLQ